MSKPISYNFPEWRGNPQLLSADSIIKHPDGRWVVYGTLGYYATVSQEEASLYILGLAWPVAQFIPDESPSYSHIF